VTHAGTRGVQLLEDGSAAVSVLHAGRGHHDYQQQADGVGDDVPLASVILSFVYDHGCDLL
jgi:hypothetical protein